MSAVAIVGAGMVTPVGFDTLSSCAAIRVGVAGFVETRFMFGGEWLIGAPVPFETGWRGREKHVQMLTAALRECLAAAPEGATSEIPVFLAVAEPDRPGRLDGLDETLLSDASRHLGLTFHSDSAVFAGGRTAGVKALEHARRALRDGHRCAVVAGVDGFLSSATLAEYERRRRLVTAENSDGFIPGEAAAAILLVPSSRHDSADALRCLGIGFAQERATLDSGEPLRGQGLADAFRQALDNAGVDWTQVDYQIAAISGEQYGFKEAALAALKTIRPIKHGFDLWHPSDCIGEVGAAVVPCMLGVALMAARKRYAPGPGVLCFVASDGERRAAMVLRSTGGPT